MRPEYNIYCDESCHLQYDKSKVMALGAVWCPKQKRQEIFTRLKEIKTRHKLSPTFELKWNKVSPAGMAYYEDVINYFFDDDDLHFRCLLVPDKSRLHHDKHGQDHDGFYYKMYFTLIKALLSPQAAYYIYLDIKDTRSKDRVHYLEQVLRNNHYDYEKKIVRRVQQVSSEEVEILQLADLLTGAIGYLHRGLRSNAGKLRIIQRMQQRSGYKLLQTTLFREEKTNLFVWRATES